jgi:hypothetical protein
MRVLFKTWDSKMASREKLFKAATEFATKLGEERLINITHSEDRDNIVITIWYWGDQEEKEEKVVKKDTMKMRPIPVPPLPSAPSAEKDETIKRDLEGFDLDVPPEKESGVFQAQPLEKSAPPSSPPRQIEINEDNW